jgi:hypothetical protein
MAGPSSSNRRVAIYQTSNPSPTDGAILSHKEIGIARSHPIGVARTQSKELRPDTFAANGVKARSPNTHPQFQNFVSIWKDPVLQAYVRPAVVDVSIPPRVK